MGYMRHDAIVVTSWSPKCIRRAHAKARELFTGHEAAVTEVTPEGMNSYSSFLVAPDGSKEAWDTSDKGDELRGLFIEWLEEARRDHGVWVDWVAVTFGGDDVDRITVQGMGRDCE